MEAFWFEVFEPAAIPHNKKSIFETIVHHEERFK
jgi:hypothetical protein